MFTFKASEELRPGGIRGLKPTTHLAANFHLYALLSYIQLVMSMHVHAYSVGGSLLAQVCLNPGPLPPSTVDPLPGQAWKEVTFSKVCLNRDDMWMCWHETQASAPHHLI